MGNTWVVDLTHFLNEEGGIAVPKGPGLNLAKHIAAIVALASRPEILPPPEYHVRCRRRPGRQPCKGMIETDQDPFEDTIVWWCPICGDNGIISNWQGTRWDLSEAGTVH